MYLTIREGDREQTVGGVTIPKGTRSVVNIRGLHLAGGTNTPAGLAPDEGTDCATLPRGTHARGTPYPPAPSAPTGAAPIPRIPFAGSAATR